VSRRIGPQAPRIGAHTSIAGSLERAAEEAAALGCNTFQIFSRSPRMWRSGKLDPAAVERLKDARERFGLTPLVVHGNYLVNLAAADAVVRQKSIAAFRDEVNRALTLGAEYLVIHPGSHRGQTLTRAMKTLAASVAKAVRGIRWNHLELLLENTAGGGASIGRDFSELAELREMIQKKASLPVGFCIDTAHSYEAGFDVSTPGGLHKTLRLIDETIGIEAVRVIHANDSKTALGSNADRHEHIGKGKIGREAFRRMLHHAKLRGKPFILETPQDEGSGHRRNVKALKTLLRCPAGDGRN
jgi:deoxyribonuclease-4